jgi:hypothetical protein
LPGVFRFIHGLSVILRPGLRRLSCASLPGSAHDIGDSFAGQWFALFLGCQTAFLHNYSKPGLKRQPKTQTAAGAMRLPLCCCYTGLSLVGLWHVPIGCLP